MLSGEARGCPGQQGAARQIFVPSTASARGGMGIGTGMRMGGLSQILPSLWDHGSHREPPRLLCSLPAPLWRGRERRQRQSRARDHPGAERGQAAPSRAGAQESIPDPSTQR